MELVFCPNPALPADGRLLFYRVRGDRAPMAEVAGLGVHATEDRARLVVPADAGPRCQDRVVAAVRLADALPPLLASTRAGRWTSASVTGYVRAARLAVGLVAEHQIAPVLRSADGRVVATWQVLLPVGGMAADALAALADALPTAAHALPRGPDAVWHPFALLRAFMDGIADALVRDRAGAGATGRPRARVLPWTARWQEASTDPDDPTVPLGAERGETLAHVGEWLRPYEQTGGRNTPELVLEPPAGPAGPWTLRLGLRDRHGAHVPAHDVWRHGDGQPERVEALLEALARAARVCGPVEQALDQRQPTAVPLDAAAAWRFIDQTAPLLTDAGYVISLPETVEHLRPHLELGTADAVGATRDGLVDARWQGVIGDEFLDADAVDELLDHDEPLVFWRGRWVRVTPQMRTQWQQRDGVPSRVPLIEAIGLAVAGVGAGPSSRVSDSTRVSTVGPLATLVDRLRDEPAPRTRAVPEGFQGDLRGYQHDAVAWLEMMHRLGLGAVLADDMGLGKTVMLIAHLLTRGRGPHLVVCPTSVVTNWERELERFAPAPALVVRRYHGPERALDVADENCVVVTSYGTLRRDIDLLAGVDWRVVALDEAQQVKNPDTLGARAVRRLRSSHCVALTGTPVENRLRELWSLLDLTNPGLLGSRAGFERRFAQPIEQRGDHVVRNQLRRLIAPFVLRRTKSDPRVAPDLPPRIERTVPCALTAGQRRRYAEAVDAFRRQAAVRPGGMRYRGAVLALLTRLKQICDHPALGAAGPTSVVGRSGKLAVTHQLLAEATQAGERVLIFTQFVGMARILADELSTAMGTPIPMLHGGMSATARQDVVDLFQGGTAQTAPPALVASLRAGGTGMNLTAATQVIHYDRWWNPAVEDQASDRAHRIGQTERVLIHRLMAVGTLEERIDALLDAKREMASAIVGSGETWITELEPAALLELVELSDRANVPDRAPPAGTVEAVPAPRAGRRP